MLLFSPSLSLSSHRLAVFWLALISLMTTPTCYHGWTFPTAPSAKSFRTSTIRTSKTLGQRQQHQPQRWKVTTVMMKLSGGATTTTPETSLSLWSRSKHWIRRRRQHQPRTDEELKLGIAAFYDRSSKLWENVWGEHMHHGYYVPANRTDHVQAQIDLIDQVLMWAHAIPKTTNSSTGSTVVIPRRVVDVGCGIGGSSRHMARVFSQLQQQQQPSTSPPVSTTTTTFSGITLSPYQAQRANELAQEQGLAATCQFQVADAMHMPFDNNTFDLVWSLESGEHMPHKQQFCQELMRVCAPGGRIILVTWCHRDLLPNETSLQPWEDRLLNRINRAYYLPKWCSVQDYVTHLQLLGATDIERDDWSYIIAPFWKAVLQSVWSWKSVVGLLQSGWTTQRGAMAMLLMLRGYQRGLIKFGCITCVKENNK